MGSTKRWLYSLTRVERALAKEVESAPSRLEGLLAVRQTDGGIADDELFEEGELEGMIRSKQEIDVLRKVSGWEESLQGQPELRQRSETAAGHADSIPSEAVRPCAEEGVEMIEDWRPLSPTMLSNSFLEEDFSDY
jgi:hypothetical protein